MKTVQVIKSFIGDAEEVSKYGNPMTGVVENVEYDQPCHTLTSPVTSPGKIRFGRKIQLTDERAEFWERLGFVKILGAAAAEPPEQASSAPDPEETAAPTAGRPPSKRGRAK